MRNRDPNSVLVHHGVKGQKRGIRRGPPYPLSEGQKSISPKDIVDIDRKDGIIRMTVDRHKSMPLTCAPNSIITHTDKGKVVGRVFYDSSGRKESEIHTHDHGHPKQHPFGEHGEHMHEYVWNEDGTVKERTLRMLSNDERKENSDIL